MRIHLHIGPGQVGADRLQAVLAAKRTTLAAKGILVPASLGARNHTRLYMAVTDPDHVDPLRAARGYADPARQAALRAQVAADLTREVEAARPTDLILTAAQLGASLHRPSELARLKALLTPLSDDISLIAHVDEPARLLARHYAAQTLEGRATSLEVELALAGSKTWWADCLAAAGPIAPDAGHFLETQAPPFWLDFTALTAFWEAAFGPGTLSLRRFDAAGFAGADATQELRAAFGIDSAIGKATPADSAPPPSAAWLARARQFNALILQLLAKGTHDVPRPLWSECLGALEVDGPPIDPAALSAISKTFQAANTALAAAHPGLDADMFKRPRARPGWQEPDPKYGFRASQYLLAFMWRIDKATRQARRRSAPRAPALSQSARRMMPPRALENFERLKSGPFVPHNRIGAVDEEQLAAAYTPAPARRLPPGSSGNVIAACMKNEAPYILEWIAYHRAIGVDGFVIYTNDCDDGTDTLLDRLDAMGIVHHRRNDAWKGKSPQQYALNRALKEPAIRQAEWIIHIDVDEFINIRTGNGTLADLFAAVPDATNIAMTWRMFGHDGITALRDAPVIDQFEACAPAYCPKPHTVWGFKTMFRNIGAYQKISCHRPNKLDPGKAGAVKWVNGSGKDMTDEVRDGGWRNSKRSIGYDLVQLNHYALRSAESFLIKRQRGRALHVDRAIGLGYWIRMDWSGARDITIRRNLPRMQAELDRLMQDDRLASLHKAGFAWHRAKAAELRTDPEFEALYDQALATQLTETERVAYALALDMES